MTPRAIPNNWQGETVVCIGGGPSLTADDLDYIRGKAKIISINDAYRVAPWSDLQYACDLKWWDWHRESIEDMPDDRWTTDKTAAQKYKLNYIPGTHADGLSDDSKLIHYGKNSGYQAINIAYLKGAARVLLLGYDMRFAEDGRSHWFGDHPDKIRSQYKGWFPCFDTIAKENKIEVINCTLTSALSSFPIKDIRRVL